MAREILVCCDLMCLAKGAEKVADSLLAAAKDNDIVVTPLVKKVGCQGLCEKGPMVTIKPDNITYYQVKVEDAEEIIASLDAEPVARLLHVNPDGKAVRSMEENSFYAAQKKITLRNTGQISPESIEEYIAQGGYGGLKKALAVTQQEVISEMAISGLGGRSGSGFPVSIKWQGCFEAVGKTRYVICNADEGDPGAFMDRSLMEGDPHSVLEGLIIAAYAVGAHKGFFYIRDEYPISVSRVQTAINAARAKGFLGGNILDSGFDFECEIVRAAGSYVCGEETALIESIEGKTGTPRKKPPFPTQKGLWGNPTIINNVETLANVPYILTHGGAEYARLGVQNSAGTKVFSLVGKVNNRGLVEVPMGSMTLRQLIFDIGGGIRDGRQFKCIQTGGPSGGFIPDQLLDLPLDFASIKASGSIMGSGGMIVMDDTTCMVDLTLHFLSFLAGESCGKCTPCREGLRCMLEILQRVTKGQAEMEDLDVLEELAYASQASACVLGASTGNPVLTTLKYFREEFEEHIKNKSCPAGVCNALVTEQKV